jgi:hypothetical protein
VDRRHLFDAEKTFIRARQLAADDLRRRRQKIGPFFGRTKFLRSTAGQEIDQGRILFSRSFVFSPFDQNLPSDKHH